MSSTSTTTSYAAVARTPSPTPSQKYVPVHRRTPSDDSGSSTGTRSPTPTPSEASTSSTASDSRVYSIASLLQLSHQPEVKVIALEQKEKLREILPEIVMSRRIRKAMEYHAIQEKVSLSKASSPIVPVPSVLQVTPTPTSMTSTQTRSRPGQRRQSKTAGGVDRRRNAVKVVDEAGWRALRPVTRVTSTA